MTDRVFGGVCGGIGNCLGVSGWWVRLTFIALALIASSFGILLYVLLWTSLPPQRLSDLPPLVHPGEPSPTGYTRPESVLTLGALSIIVGVFILADQTGFLRAAGGADLLAPGMLFLIGFVVLLKHLRGVA
jgi:phage shock protein PspC (stress-responsive transcriptional regulator)